VPVVQTRWRQRTLALPALAGLVALLAAACGGSSLETHGSTTVGGPQPPPTTSEPSPTATTPEPLPRPRVLVFLTRDEKVTAVSRTVEHTPAIASAALRALLAGPDAGERAQGLGSAIPAGTQLRGISLADGVATVDLSSDFASGGGSLSASLRLAQVVYTLTQFATIESVRLRLDGEPVTTFMGEGLDVSRPQTRGDYESVTPRILVESPTPGAVVSCPLRITGTSNDFEATFLAEVWVDGTKVGSWPVMATSGNGTRGSFDATLCEHAEIAGQGDASLVVYEPSAEDGRPLGKVEVPLRYQR
jgi:germination protein M